MTLVMGVIATSPAGGDREQAPEVAHDFELVDFQPLDTGDDAMMDDETMMEESDDGTSEEPQMQESESTDPAFMYENCDAAREDGAAPVLEGEHGFGPHLDADNDGIGCEHWSGPSNGDTNTSESGYQNCTEASADGRFDIPESDPAYAEHLDGDNDGVACES
ncbi:MULTISPECIES: excalibur calcium-binding domain-containing protein [Glycomyces]|uniref:Excalibur calcium-binding domain-containing protein n=2 Tax=Glycomyces TaxID=58113 RepID=A0A9X3SST1_9ACTN|nr:excalibur calcium-binding domain-containing protein [Glycomyces lechevalierae]MDA1383445.1 excalibur calcium-binding domain-containing protein [Glycomyces lechevalierae]MDR7336451.1 hypothetical protein [Glycomyces lechevalierae]